MTNTKRIERELNRIRPNFTAHEWLTQKDVIAHAFRRLVGPDDFEDDGEGEGDFVTNVGKHPMTILFGHAHSVTRVNRVDIITDAYCLAHGKTPRDNGHWMFGPFADIDGTDSRIIRISGLYSKARHQASLIAAARGDVRLFVLA